MDFIKKYKRYQQTIQLGITVAFLLTNAGCFSTPTPAALPTLQLTSTPTAVAATPTTTPTHSSSVLLPTPTLTPIPTLEPIYQSTTITAGETFALGDLVLTVTLVPTTTVIPTAQPGRQLVFLDMVIQNTGEQLVSINADEDFILKDNTNRFYRIDTAAVTAIRGTVPNINLMPGETIRAQLGFNVPANVNGLTLSFAADKFKAGRIFVGLPSALVSLPTETPTETPNEASVITTTTIISVPTALPTATLAALPSPTTPPNITNVTAVLLEPNDGGTYGGNVTFRWSITAGNLPVDQAYEVIIYQEGQDPLQTGLGLAAPTTTTDLQVNLAGLDAEPNFPLEPGPYLWGVRLIEQSTGRPLGMAAEGRKLIFERTSAP